MKFSYFSAIFLAGLLVLMSSCKHEHGEDTHVHGDETHEPHGDETYAVHEPDFEPIAITIWTKKTELFVEFPPLIVGQESHMIVHLTEMENYKALSTGVLLFRIREEAQVLKEQSITIQSSGIFPIVIMPDKQGVFDLEFNLETPSFLDTLTISNITVYPDSNAAFTANIQATNGAEISVFKNQLWKIDFAIQQVQRKPIQEVIHTSGEFQPIKGAEKIIAAKSSGIVFYKSKNLQEGRDVRFGEHLFTISSKGLLQANMEEKYLVAKANIEKTKADFERAEKLVQQQIIGQKEYERRKMDYTIAQAEFQTLTGSYNADGQAVTATMSGLVKNVMVSDGQFVQEGTPLIEITNSRRLLLQAEVAQGDLSKLRMVKSANFKTPYMEEVQSTDDYNGKLISYGKAIEPGSSFLPVLFELDNLHELVPGSYVELFLLANAIDNSLVIPKSALMQDYNLNYVYVQTGGESFEKREVRIGIDNGLHVQILSGVTEGEWIVTKGAYQIKMASMSSSIPEHGHDH